MVGLNATWGVPKITGAAWPGVTYFCTLRQGGVSTGACATLNFGTHVADDPVHVAQNRRLLAAELPGPVLWLNQVHGIEVFDADKPYQPDVIPTADAAITTCKHRVLAIMTADCLPIVIADTEGQALGVAHAGWRGLANGVLEQTVLQLRRKHTRALQLQAWVGPAISQRYFEVGADVFAAFVDKDPATRAFFIAQSHENKWRADLAGLAQYRLNLAGVASIQLSGSCTYGQPDQFYSYRRDPHTGRMVTIAWLSDNNVSLNMSLKV